MSLTLEDLSKVTQLEPPQTVWLQLEVTFYANEDHQNDESEFKQSKLTELIQILLRSWVASETKAVRPCPNTSPSHCEDVIGSACTVLSGILKPCSFTSLESGRGSFITHYQFCPFSKQYRIIFNTEILYNSWQVKGGVRHPLQNYLPLPSL